MCFLTDAIVFAAAHVALAAPVYSLAHGTQDGVSVVILDGNGTVQRDYYDKDDLMTREPTLFQHKARFRSSGHGLSEADKAQKKLEGESKEGNSKGKTGHFVAPSQPSRSNFISSKFRPPIPN
ncbi:hypothetical protein K439DRAFT_1611496 [Ramaria rubella]|nr:hypothetical protein K439DRAFT_1611496 [Ramaria rubella]